MKENTVFADAFNKFIYKGEQVIKPENLKPLDTDLTGIPYGADGAGVPVQRYRDVLKSVTAMEDNSKVYLLLAVEAQSEVHYAMPVRIMVYDALQYAAQVEEAARSHREARKADEMLAVQEPEILSLVSDYKLNLIAPEHMSDEEIDQFQTSLREVMLFI